MDLIVCLLAGFGTGRVLRYVLDFGIDVSNASALDLGKGSGC